MLRTHRPPKPAGHNPKYCVSVGSSPLRYRVPTRVLELFESLNLSFDTRKPGLLCFSSPARSPCACLPVAACSFVEGGAQFRPLVATKTKAP
jgi:hypothetical protein